MEKAISLFSREFLDLLTSDTGLTIGAIYVAGWTVVLLVAVAITSRFLPFAK